MNLQAFYIFLMVSLADPSPEMQEYMGKIETGMASYYAPKFNGRQTSYGEVFNNREFTAAHPTLPYNTLIEVTNLQNNQKVNVRVTDRGPFSKSRLIDLSKSAAREIGMVHSGIAKVQLKVIGAAGLVMNLPRKRLFRKNLPTDYQARETLATEQDEGFLY